jgi:phage tail sheath protein FI
MADGYVHGIVIKEGSGEVRTIRSPSPSVVGLVGTAVAAGTTLKALVPEVFFKENAALEAVYPSGSSGPKGSLHQALRGVYEQTDATVVVVRAQSDSDADIMAAIEKLEDAEALTGFKPKILAAPGFGYAFPAVIQSAVPPLTIPVAVASNKKTTSTVEVING